MIFKNITFFKESVKQCKKALFRTPDETKFLNLEAFMQSMYRKLYIYS